MAEEKELVLQAQGNSYTPEQKKMLQDFFKNEELSNFIKEQFLAGAMQHDSLDRIVASTGMNWVLGISTDLDDVQYAQIVKRNSYTIMKFDNIWKKMEYGAKALKEKKEQINQAK